MSRQLSRIRSIISEIEEIQKQGQAEGRAQMQQRPQAPQAPLTQREEPVILPVEPEPMAEVVEFKQPVKEEKEVGKIAIQLTGNVVVALQIENTNETVEIRQVHDSIEIRFADGKAVHLPLKNVA